MRTSNPLDIITYESEARGELFVAQRESKRITIPAMSRFSLAQGLAKGRNGILAISWEIQNLLKDVVEDILPKVEVEIGITRRLSFCGRIAQELDCVMLYGHVSAILDMAHSGKEVMSKEHANLFLVECGLIRAEWENNGWRLCTHSTGSTVMNEVGTWIFRLAE